MRSWLLIEVQETEKYLLSVFSSSTKQALAIWFIPALSYIEITKTLSSMMRLEHVCVLQEFPPLAVPTELQQQGVQHANSKCCWDVGVMPFKNCCFSGAVHGSTSHCTVSSSCCCQLWDFCTSLISVPLQISFPCTYMDSTICKL